MSRTDCVQKSQQKLACASVPTIKMRLNSSDVHVNILINISITNQS